MIYYQWDESTGFYSGQGAATPGDIPGSFIYPLNSCLDAPPADIPEGKIARRDEHNTAWEIVDAPAPADLRQAAYEAEADPLFREAQYYQAEADGLYLLGKPYQWALDKASDLLKQYAAAKAEVRERFKETVDDVVREVVDLRPVGEVNGLDQPADSPDSGAVRESGRVASPLSPLVADAGQQP